MKFQLLKQADYKKQAQEIVNILHYIHLQLQEDHSLIWMQYVLFCHLFMGVSEK
jgi:hypothetical protein